MAAFAIVPTAVDEYTLEQRGHRSVCKAQDYDARTRTATTTDADGHSSTRTWTEYVYRLECPGDGPRAMTTTKRVARKGESLEVAWDPNDWVAARPAPATSSADDMSWALILTGGAIFLRLSSATGRTLKERRDYTPAAAGGEGAQR
ncbi:hypothetical protein [Embleya sp. NBC_00896]|uniref:hypothetical protein n=1 Tax=Embleya sp. NBC_00896 TaxID=2975961 RepID=UPI00386EA230|nr:hypothetical protein OG928_46340 [Embleya sp. NBC_00896]